MKVLRFLNGSKFWVWFHGCLVILWVLVWIVAAIMGWLESVVFVSHLSAVALVLASLAGWQGARTEVKEDERNGDS
jgi:hypothetical protein